MVRNGNVFMYSYVRDTSTWQTGGSLAHVDILDSQTNMLLCSRI